MRDSKIKPKDPLNLYQRALKIHKKNITNETSNLLECDKIKLIHELEVHQIELELQNEELQLTQANANAALEKYTEFYEFASLGYVILDTNATVLDANKVACQLLKVDKSNLIDSNLKHYIADHHKPAFKEFFSKLFLEKTVEDCLLRLKGGKDVKDIKISGSVINSQSNQCFLKITNLTAAEQLQEAILEKEFFQEFQRVGQIGWYKVNITNNVWEFSEMLYFIFGLKNDAVVNYNNWIDCVHPDDRTEIQLYLKKTIKNKTSFKKEYRIIRKNDGVVRWVDGNGRFNYDKKSNEINFFGVVQDITEQKLSLEKILSAESWSNRLFETSNEGILILDSNSGKVTDANTFFIEMIGFNHEQLVGKALWELCVFKNTIISKETFTELKEKKYCRFENQLLETKLGKLIDVEFELVVYMEESHNNVLCHIRDISDRKKAENALKESGYLYQAMFEKNQAPQLMINPTNGNIVDANSAAAKFYGYSLGEFKLMNLSDISTFPADQIIEEIGKFGVAGSSYFQFLHKFSSGTTREVEIYTSQLLINGQFLLIATINDITERKLEEERLKHLNQQLLEVNTLKSQFISTVSHEFRTPLAGILSSVQLLQIYNDTWNEEKKEKIFKQIFDAVEHTKALLDDVSLIDEEQNSKSFFRPTNIKLLPLINEIIEENISAAGTNHKVIVSSKLASKTYYMDVLIIRHIFTNIISNAIKYSCENKKITIDIDEVVNKEIKFIITDRGIGIPSEEISYLLEPFYRASNHGAIKGTGFGLSIVKRFIDLHKGQILIESVVSEGTKVTIILPYFQRENSEDEPLNKTEINSIILNQQ